MIRILVTAPLAREAIEQLNVIPEFEVGFRPGAALAGLDAEMREAEALVCADAGELTRRALARATVLRLVIVCGGAAAVPTAAKRGVEVRRSDGGLSTIALLKDFFNA